MLWNLGGEKASQVYSAWDTAVKLTWSCPRWTRTFLLQQVLSCGSTSARTDILCWYGKFFRGLRTSISQEVRCLVNLVSRDLQSTTAKNLKLVQSQSGCDLWTSGPVYMKQALHDKQTVEIPSQEEWKVQYLSSLLSQLAEAKSLVQKDRINRLQELLDSLVR